MQIHGVGCPRDMRLQRQDRQVCLKFSAWVRGLQLNQRVWDQSFWFFLDFDVRMVERRLMLRRALERELSTGSLQKQPMCMVQYDRILSCYRQPGNGEDVQLLRPRNIYNDEHIIVAVQNQVHKLKMWLFLYENRYELH